MTSCATMTYRAVQAVASVPAATSFCPSRLSMPPLPRLNSASATASTISLRFASTLRGGRPFGFSSDRPPSSRPRGARCSSDRVVTLAAMASTAMAPSTQKATAGPNWTVPKLMRPAAMRMPRWL